MAVSAAVFKITPLFLSVALHWKKMCLNLSCELKLSLMETDRTISEPNMKMQTILTVSYFNHTDALNFRNISYWASAVPYMLAYYDNLLLNIKRLQMCAT